MADYIEYIKKNIVCGYPSLNLIYYIILLQWIG